MNKWEIYFCDLNPSTGSEQRGQRPVIIISNNSVNHHLPVSTVLPISSFNPKDLLYPTEVLLPAAMTGLPKDSVVMIQQIRTVSHLRLLNKAGQLIDPDLQDTIKETIKLYFEL